MALSETFRAGYFTSDGASVIVPLLNGVDKFVLTNWTNMTTNPNPGEVFRAEWFRGLSDNEAMLWKNTNSSAAVERSVITSGGFKIVNTSEREPEAEKTSTGITNAGPPVVTVSSHGYNTGDVVRVYDSTGALQIGGMEFEINKTGTNTFTLRYMIAPGSAATAAKVRRIPYEDLYKPRNRFITNITQAASAVVTLSVSHGYSVGEKIRFKVAEEFGMKEIDGKIGEITAVNTTNNTVTVDIDSQSFSAWTWPSASDVAFTFAQTIPVGEVPTIQSAATQNASKKGILLGSSLVGANSDVLYWEAYKAFDYSTSL